MFRFVFLFCGGGGSSWFLVLWFLVFGFLRLGFSVFGF